MAYVDANIFVFAAIRHPDEAKTAQSISVLRKIAEKRLPASTSVLTWDELVWVCRRILPLREALKEGKTLIEFPNLNFVDATLPVMHKAEEIMEKYALRPRDSIHAATAILSGETTIISDDSDFDKITELKRIPLSAAGK